MSLSLKRKATEQLSAEYEKEYAIIAQDNTEVSRSPKGFTAKHHGLCNCSMYCGLTPIGNIFTPQSDEGQHISNLLENNKQWAKHHSTRNPDYFAKLGQPQKPKYLYFGCSDSRVPANEILGLGPGEMFVHRNIGNLVPGNDLNALSVIEYAVDHLGVTDIIVTGHYNCGACKAATASQDLGILENWLRLIRDVYRLHRDFLDKIASEEDRHHKLVELNVVEQCLNVYKTGVVQKHRNNPNTKNVPRIHGLVFDTANGLLKRLDIDYERIGNLGTIYNLYEPPSTLLLEDDKSKSAKVCSTSLVVRRITSPEEEDFQNIANLLENNKRWVKHLSMHSPDYFAKLGQSQKPKYLYFGCSDSRVPANEVLGLGPGEVFVHRNVGNLVPGNDLSALAVIEYAVDHLGVTDIIVTGHYNCGACKAAVTTQDLGLIENWIRVIRDVYRLHKDFLDKIKDPEAQHRKLVELNVVEQCVNIFKTAVVQRRRILSAREPGSDIFPRVHGLVFDTAEGILKRLDVDYSRVGSLQSVYALYPSK